MSERRLLLRIAEAAWDLREVVRERRTGTVTTREIQVASSFHEALDAWRKPTRSRALPATRQATRRARP